MFDNNTREIAVCKDNDLEQSSLTDIELVAAIAAAIETYGQLKEQRYQIINVKPINKGFTPWRLLGLYNQLGR